MGSPDRPLLLVTTGEPAGIGPDICVSLLADLPDNVDIVIAGDRRALEERGTALGMAVAAPDHDPTVRVPAAIMDMPVPAPVKPGQPEPRNAAAVLASLHQAIALATGGAVDALVTGPVAKDVLAHADPTFTGHTGLLATTTGTQAVMCFVGPRLRVALVTDHLPLAAVPAAITPATVFDALMLADQGMRAVLDGQVPRWLACGLNPHAGEGGLLGKEDAQAVAPALARARQEGVAVEGPVPADTAFLPDRLDGRTCVLALYHDQALPVVKRDAFASTVNVTFGLPFVRTSVDHGTAFDLAATGTADGAPLRAAVDLAARLAARARPHRLVA